MNARDLSFHARLEADSARPEEPGISAGSVHLNRAHTSDIALAASRLSKRVGPSLDELSFQRSKGEDYRAVFQKVYGIIALQRARPGIKGIRGFVFYGE